MFRWVLPIATGALVSAHYGFAPTAAPQIIYYPVYVPQMMDYPIPYPSFDSSSFAPQLFQGRSPMGFASGFRRYGPQGYGAGGGSGFGRTVQDYGGEVSYDGGQSNDATNWSSGTSGLLNSIALVGTGGVLGADIADDEQNTNSDRSYVRTR